MYRFGLDRRRAQRFRVELFVELEHETGITRDVSDSGVFIVTQGSFSPGDPIEFTLVFEHLHPDHPVRLQCRGHVVRIEQSDGKTGVAVAITGYRVALQNNPGLCHQQEFKGGPSDEDSNRSQRAGPPGDNQ